MTNLVKGQFERGLIIPLQEEEGELTYLFLEGKGQGLSGKGILFFRREVPQTLSENNHLNVFPHSSS